MSNEQQRSALTVEVAQSIGQALARLQEIGNSVIIDPKHEAEVKGIRAYLASTVPQHANELLACWFAVHNEYEPLINGFVGLLTRANAVIGARQQQIQAAAQATAPERPVSQ